MQRAIKRRLGRLFYQMRLDHIVSKCAYWASVPSDSPVDRRQSVRFYETPTGKYYLPTDAPHDIVINEIRRGHVFDAELVALVQEYARPGTAILDVGANFGQMAVLFAKMVGAEGRVHSFEADEFIFELLQKTLAANACDNVVAHFGAVYDQPDKELFYPEQDFTRFSSYGSYGIDPKASAGRKLKSLTIDSLKIEMPISFMKVDIQGSDLFAMRGAIETIRRHRMPILFEFEQRFQEEFNTSFQDYVDFVAAIGYRFDRTLMDINYLIVPR